MLYIFKLSLVSHYPFLQDKFASSSYPDAGGFLLSHSYLALSLLPAEQTPYGSSTKAPFPCISALLSDSFTCPWEGA